MEDKDLKRKLALAEAAGKAWKFAAEIRLEKLNKAKELLKMAKCRHCDGSGAYYDNMGGVCQCRWCDERTRTLE